jgi:hypothetical protein
MNFFKNGNNSGDNSTSSESNPMKMVQTPQVPTQVQRDSGNEVFKNGGNTNGKQR